MRFAFLVATAAVVGAVAAFATPASLILSASLTIDAVSTKAGHIPHDLADLNPIRLAYDVVAQRIREGDTPEQLGFKPSPVTFKPFVMPTSSFDFNQYRYSGNGIYSGMAAEIEQNNRRMEDMRIYAQNPAAWHGAPPH